VKRKGIIVSAFFGVILLTSTIALVLPNTVPESEQQSNTVTGTPADNFPDEQRAQFCGSGNAKSTPYVQEYSIPTECTNPLAVVTDFDGNVWFAETNTGKLAKFDPVTEQFTEYNNPSWPKGGRSMMWGIDYSPDGSVWFTDEAYDSIWKFSPDTQKYQRLGYPSEGNSLPQRLKVDGSQIIVNDFTGNKITFLDPTQSGDEMNYLSLPSPVDNSVTSAFAIDANNMVWYTNWIFQESGILVKYDHDGFQRSVSMVDEESLPLFDFIEIFELPPEILTPNGVAISDDGMVWLADTSSSHFFSFDPNTEQFTQYITSTPQLMTYGNLTGVIKSPISRPYWVDVDSTGRLVFNEQTSNTIAVMDLETEKLVEYSIPSKNPNWGDCGALVNCGLAQVFDFTVDRNNIWFTEWVENNIGVIDTSVNLPLDIDFSSNTIATSNGTSADLDFDVIPLSDSGPIEFYPIVSSPNKSLKFNIDTSKSITLKPDAAQKFNLSIQADEDAVPGVYKVLLGAQTEHVSIGKFVTVTIEP